jgi:hypothetical protein
VYVWAIIVNLLFFLAIAIGLAMLINEKAALSERLAKESPAKTALCAG